MNPVTVYIATTASPVAIQRITEEDPEVNSVICLAGKAVSLPISGAYDAFVRNPTGVIQRDFGHSAYRIDVSDKIDEGYSWQLGVFTAHALQRTARLAPPGENAETVVIATGEVDRDLNLHPVDGVAEKIKILGERLPELTGNASKLVIAVPAGTEGPWRQAFGTTELAGGLSPEIMAVGNAGDLLDRLGLSHTAGPAKNGTGSQIDVAVQQPNRRGKILLLAIALIMVAMVAVAGGAAYSPEIKAWVTNLSNPPVLKPAEPAEPTPAPSVVTNSKPTQTTSPAPIIQPTSAPSSSQAPTPRPEPTPPELTTKIAEQIKPRKGSLPPKPMPPTTRTKAKKNDRIEEARLPATRTNPINVSIVELRAPPGYSCASVRNGRIEPIRLAVASNNSRRLAPSSQKNLCTVEIRAVTEDNATHVYGRYMRWTQTRPNEGPPDKIIDLGPRRRSVHWTVDIPDQLDRSAVFRVVLFTTAKEFTPSRRVLSRLTRLSPRDKKVRKTLRRLRKRGITITMRRFRVIPERDRLPTPTIDPRDNDLRPSPSGGFRSPPGFPPPPRR